MSERSRFSTSLQTLVIIGLFDYSHPGGRECDLLGFPLALAQRLRVLRLFYVFTGEMSIQEPTFKLGYLSFRY